MKKIIRTICLFSDQVSNQEIEKLEKISQLLQEKGFLIQTKRICLSDYKTPTNDKELLDKGILLGSGEQSFEKLKANFADFLKSENKAISLDVKHPCPEGRALNRKQSQLR